MIPAKMTSEPQDLQNYLQAPQNWSPSLSDVTKPPAILSPRQKNLFRMHIHPNVWLGLSLEVVKDH